MTIASAVETEERLATLEAQHACPERALANLMALGKSAETGTTSN